MALSKTLLIAVGALVGAGVGTFAASYAINEYKAGHGANAETAASPLGSAPAGPTERLAGAAANVEIEHFVGIVEHSVGTGPDVQIEVIQASGLPQAVLSQAGGSMRISMPDQNWRTTRCSVTDGRLTELRLNGRSYSEETLPRIRITAPAGTTFKITDGIVGGQMGDVGAAEVENAGCLTLTLGNVAGDLGASIGGSGEIVAGNVGGSAAASIGGSGDIQLGTVSKTGSFSIGGSGSITASSVAGPLEASIAGSGDIEVKEGRVALKASIAGSGDITIGGVAVNPVVSVVGSGDVVAAAIEGRPSVSSVGSGRLIVGKE
jgi:hypothetical protein